MRHRALPFAVVAVLALVGLVAPESTLRASQSGTPTSPLDGASSQSGATVTPVGTCPPSPAVLDYVALGDSIASGHGLQDAGAPCRRSGLSYPAKVHAQLERDHGPVAFVHLACSGATALPPFAPPDDPLKLLPQQVDQALAALSDRPTLVSLTVGADDYNFAGPAHMFDRLFVNDQPTFEAFADTIATQVRNAVGDEVRRLLDRPNVAVVLTEVHNPFNTRSVFFEPADPASRPVVGIGCALSDCYGRVEYVIDGLNAALRGVVEDVGQPDRLVMTDGVRDAFREHAGPMPSCGHDAPDIALTWIQFRDDPASNSYPPDMPEWIAGAGQEWRGDCIHPNEPGARHYAEAVHAAAQMVLPTSFASSPTATMAPVPPMATPGIVIGQLPSASVPAAALAVDERRSLDLPNPPTPEPGNTFISPPTSLGLSPNGRWLAFYFPHKWEGTPLCIYEVATLAEHLCVDLEVQGFSLFDEHSFAWSPHSTRATFTESWYKFRVDSDVWVLDVTTGVLTNLTDDGVTDTESALPFHTDERPAWSPDGRSLAFARTTIQGDSVKWGLYLIAVNGGEPIEVGLVSAAGGSSFFMPRLIWSADGASLLYTFVSYTLESELDDQTTAVWIIDIDGTQPRQLAAPSETLGSPFLQDVSAQGMALVAYHQDSENPGDVTYSFVLVDIGTGAVTTLNASTARQADPSKVAFSPDGSELLYTTFGECPCGLAVRDIESTEEHYLLEGGGFIGERVREYGPWLFWAANDVVYLPTSHTTGLALRLGIGPIATPTPLPTPPANPQTSDSPAAIAEGFYLASLERAEAGYGASPPSGWYDYFAPDRSPDPTDFVFNLLATCREVSYETVERQSVQFGVQYAEVTFVFRPECPRDGSDVDRFVVYLERSTGRWYVYDAETRT